MSGPAAKMARVARRFEDKVAIVTGGSAGIGGCRIAAPLIRVHCSRLVHVVLKS